MKSTRLPNYKDIEINRDQFDSKEQIEKLIRRVYNSIPKKYVYERSDIMPVKLFKPLIETDADLTIRNLAGQIWSDGQTTNPYKAFSELARSRGRKSWLGTKDEVWNLFRTDPSTSPVYNKFNSYMYRNGYSASQYWFVHSSIKRDGAVIYATCELPEKTKGVRYDTLEIEYDKSSGEIVAYMTL